MLPHFKHAAPTDAPDRPRAHVHSGRNCRSRKHFPADAAGGVHLIKSGSVGKRTRRRCLDRGPVCQRVLLSPKPKVCRPGKADSPELSWGACLSSLKLSTGACLRGAALHMAVLKLRRPCCDKRAALTLGLPLGAQAHRARHAQLYHVSTGSVQLQHCLCCGVQVGVSCHKEGDESVPAPPPSTTQLVPALSANVVSLSAFNLTASATGRARQGALHLMSLSGPPLQATREDVEHT